MTFPFVLWVGEGEVALTDDFEAELNQWVTYGSGGPFSITDVDWHSPTHSVTESPSGHYGNRWDVAMESAHAFDLSEAKAGSLIFWHKYAIEEGYDWGSVEITEDGQTWISLGAYTGYQEEWTREAIDLTPYLPTPYFKVRFHFTSDYYVTEDGWFIDDVTLLFDTFEVGIRESELPRVVAYPWLSPTLLRSGEGIELVVPKSGVYTIDLFDRSGRLIRSLYRGYLERGKRSFEIVGLSTGTYFVLLKNREVTRRAKIVFFNR
jgi:hypothetical protein